MIRLASPEFVGCVHTKLQLQHPDSYTVRRPLIEQLLRSFFGILWNDYHPHQRRLALHVLDGPHAEKAVIKVTSSHWCNIEQHLVSRLPSRTRMGSAYIFSTDAVSLRRAELVSFMSEHASPAVRASELSTRMDTLGDGQARLTERAIAGLLRTYTAHLK
uniref:Uncharacterized protein n=1 Tax=Coccolithus braarudii TaxID=221442 RepID=A0A7S0Q4H2_9EUKA